MKWEERLIIASLLTGITDIIFGLIMSITGLHIWYYNHFHNFGVFGFSMIAYAGWHKFLMEANKNDR